MGVEGKNGCSVLGLDGEIKGVGGDVRNDGDDFGLWRPLSYVHVKRVVVVKEQQSGPVTHHKLCKN